jgi:hypothetical protein
MMDSLPANDSAFDAITACGHCHATHGHHAACESTDDLRLPLEDLARDTYDCDEAWTETEFARGACWCLVKLLSNGVTSTKVEAHGTTFRDAMRAAIDDVLEDHQLGVDASLAIAALARKACAR